MSLIDSYRWGVPRVLPRHSGTLAFSSNPRPASRTSFRLRGAPRLLRTPGKRCRGRGHVCSPTPLVKCCSGRNPCRIATPSLPAKARFHRHGRHAPSRRQQGATCRWPSCSPPAPSSLCDRPLGKYGPEPAKDGQQCAPAAPRTTNRSPVGQHVGEGPPDRSIPPHRSFQLSLS